MQLRIPNQNSWSHGGGDYAGATRSKTDIYILARWSPGLVLIGYAPAIAHAPRRNLIVPIAARRLTRCETLGIALIRGPREPRTRCVSYLCKCPRMRFRASRNLFFVLQSTITLRPVCAPIHTKARYRRALRVTGANTRNYHRVYL